jgi:hypothetical protein
MSMERSPSHPISCSGDDRAPQVGRPVLETPASRRGFLPEELAKGEVYYNYQMTDGGMEA